MESHNNIGTLISLKTNCFRRGVREIGYLLSMKICFARPQKPVSEEFAEYKQSSYMKAACRVELRRRVKLRRSAQAQTAANSGCVNSRTN